MKSFFKNIRFGKREQFITFVGIVAIFVAVGYYSIQLYEETGAEQEGLIVCNEQKCEKSEHIHADIAVSVCGEQIDFPKNTGSVLEQHTHAEQNYMHLHIKFEIDRETEQPLDTSLHKLGNFFKNMDMAFSAQPATIGEYTIGNTCPNGKTLMQDSLRMKVNGKENTEFEQYQWRDGDAIEITFE